MLRLQDFRVTRHLPERIFKDRELPKDLTLTGTVPKLVKE